MVGGLELGAVPFRLKVACGRPEKRPLGIEPCG